MKRLFYLSSFCIVLVILLPGRSLAQCTGERWSVKTGTDADVALVNLNSTKSTTIRNMTAIPAPNPLPDNNRVKPTETTVWVINATLKEYIRAYDGDYHMVIKDDAGRTMIAEIPSPTCIGPGNPFAAGISHARAQFDAM